MFFEDRRRKAGKLGWEEYVCVCARAVVSVCRLSKPDQRSRGRVEQWRVVELCSVTTIGSFYPLRLFQFQRHNANLPMVATISDRFPLNGKLF